jgi:hypothetical protein
VGIIKSYKKLFYIKDIIMKKLAILSLLIAFSANMQAINITKKSTFAIGQMCGKDDCGCPDNKIFGPKEKPEAN